MKWQSKDIQSWFFGKYFHKKSNKQIGLFVLAKQLTLFVSQDKIQASRWKLGI